MQKFAIFLQYISLQSSLPDNSSRTFPLFLVNFVFPIWYFNLPILSHNFLAPVLSYFSMPGCYFSAPKAPLFGWYISAENTVSFPAVDGPQGFSVARGHSHFWGRRMLLLLSLLYPPSKTTDLQPWSSKHRTSVISKHKAQNLLSRLYSSTPI